MAKVNLKNVKSKSNKNNNKKKQDLINKEKEEKQKEWENNIIEKSTEIINKLNNEINKTFKFNRKKREIAKSKINDINILIDNKEFKELENLLKAFEKFENENKHDEQKNESSKEPLKSRLQYWFKNMRIPFYTRIKNTIINDTGKTRMLKLLAIFGVAIVAIIVLIISILMIINVIPFSMGNSNEVTNILPAILIAISIGVLYFI